MSIKPFTVHEAKTHLSRLIEQAEAGKEVVIARGKVPVVRLVPIPKMAVCRRFGSMKGRATVTKVFFEPLPEDELRAWE
jgi:prevent-host-death family protein